MPLTKVGKRTPLQTLLLCTGSAQCIPPPPAESQATTYDIYLRSFSSGVSSNSTFYGPISYYGGSISCCNVKQGVSLDCRQEGSVDAGAGAILFQRYLIVLSATAKGAKVEHDIFGIGSRSLSRPIFSRKHLVIRYWYPCPFWKHRARKKHRIPVRKLNAVYGKLSINHQVPIFSSFGQESSRSRAD